MTRSFLPTAAVTSALAAAAVLLAGCGGGSGGSKTIDSSDRTTTSAAAPTQTATATPSDQAKGPSTALPKDLTMTFDWPSTGDATKDAVLDGGRQYLKAYNRAAAAHDLKDPAYQFYSRDDALTYARDQINQNIKDDLAPTGLDRYYSATVSDVQAGSATLSFCEDQSKSYSKEVKTGKVLVTTPSIDDYYQYNLLLFKDTSNGVWQASKITVLEAPKCKR
ncbi:MULTISPECIES: hypothetical protein [Streptomycetaceae]|uniref:hypothetical protein n=1 Tax=Streptomycetaceae TaxID=2062 RepID=UPI0030092160